MRTQRWDIFIKCHCYDGRRRNVERGFSNSHNIWTFYVSSNSLSNIFNSNFVFQVLYNYTDGKNNILERWMRFYGQGASCKWYFEGPRLHTQTFPKFTGILCEQELHPVTFFNSQMCAGQALNCYPAAWCFLKPENTSVYGASKTHTYRLYRVSTERGSFTGLW